MPQLNSILSSNYLVEYHDEFETLVDMETFDFFYICEEAKVNCLGAIRVVSDVIGDENHKATRLSVSFERTKHLSISLASSVDQKDVPGEFDSTKEQEIRPLFDKVCEYIIRIKGRDVLDGFINSHRCGEVPTIKNIEKHLEVIFMELKRLCHKVIEADKFDPDNYDPPSDYDEDSPTYLINVERDGQKYVLRFD